MFVVVILFSSNKSLLGIGRRFVAWELIIFGYAGWCYTRNQTWAFK